MQDHQIYQNEQEKRIYLRRFFQLDKRKKHGIIKIRIAVNKILTYFYILKRKILISTLIFIYSFTCLNAVVLYAFHNFIHEHLISSVCENEMEHNKDSSGEDCPLIKVINKTHQFNSSTDIDVPVEVLSIHLISDSTIPIPGQIKLPRNIQFTFLLTLHLSRPAPPPKHLS